MLGLMNNDKDSILNNNTFMNNIKETIYSMSNQISTTTPMQNTQNTQNTKNTQNTQNMQNINNYTSCIDDLD
jgi:spore germination cell wall hydrolase CwlJ-like protein